jgi:hypothetical protein
MKLGRQNPQIFKLATKKMSSLINKLTTSTGLPPLPKTELPLNNLAYQWKRCVCESRIPSATQQQTPYWNQMNCGSANCQCRPFVGDGAIYWFCCHCNEMLYGMALIRCSNSSCQHPIRAAVDCKCVHERVRQS